MGKSIAGDFMRKNFFWIVILPSYLFLGILLLPYYQYQINPDGVSYISIAQKYLSGHWREAVNGYWSPLFSWLLIPFLYFKIPALLASKIISLGAGAFVLMQMKLFFRKLNISDQISLVSLFSFIPIVLRWVCYAVSPDLLLVPILLAYLYCVHLHKWGDENFFVHGLVCGVLGGMAYLCKAYAFFFFLTHYFLFGLLFEVFQRGNQRKSTFLKKSIVCLMVFFLISGSWVSLLYKKYHKLTINTAAEFNISLRISRFPGFPMLTRGLLPLPDDFSVSFWDDPKVFRNEKFGGLSVRDGFFLYVKMFFQNVRSARIYFQDISPFLPAFFLLGALIVFPPFKTREQKCCAYFIAALGLYISGYLFIYLEERYVWIAAPLMGFVSGLALEWLIESKNFSKVQQGIILFCYALSLLFYPCKYMYLNLNTGKEVLSLSSVLSASNIHGNIAADPGYWPEGLYVSYYLGGRFYGVPEYKVSPRDIEKTLLQYGIDYYLVFNKNAQIIQSGYYKELLQKNPFGVRVLKRI